MPRSRDGLKQKDYDPELVWMQNVTNQTGYVWTQDEIADICGITRQRVKQLERSGLKRILNVLTNDPRLSQELRDQWQSVDGSRCLILSKAG